MFDWLTNSTAIIIILPVVVFILTMFFQFQTEEKPAENYVSR